MNVTRNGNIRFETVLKIEIIIPFLVRIGERELFPFRRSVFVGGIRGKKTSDEATQLVQLVLRKGLWNGEKTVMTVFFASSRGRNQKQHTYAQK